MLAVVLCSKQKATVKHDEGAMNDASTLSDARLSLGGWPKAALYTSIGASTFVVLFHIFAFVLESIIFGSAGRRLFGDKLVDECNVFAFNQV